jgi:hypothetical protein
MTLRRFLQLDVLSFASLALFAVYVAAIIVL